MSQQEVIQAIKNLGNRAFYHELIEEYFKLHYPDPNYRKEHIQDRKYPLRNSICKYLSILKRNGILKTRKIYIPYGDKSNPIVKKGGKKNWIEYYLTSDDDSNNNKK